VASFLVQGHASTGSPAWLLLPLLAIHALGIAYWIGALLPLHYAARRLPPPEIAPMMARFGRIAVGFVGALALSGAIMALLYLGDPMQLFTSGYGRLLLAKLVGVCCLLALAAGNKRRFVPGLSGPAPDGARRALTRSIGLEILLVGLILLVTASLTTLTPAPELLT